jgi:putative transcriptional regulator
MIGGGNNIDRRVYRSRRGDELEIGKALDEVSGQRGPLTHDTHDVKREQPLNHCLWFGKVVPKYRYIGSIAEYRPIDDLKRHVLWLCRAEAKAAVFECCTTGVRAQIRSICSFCLLRGAVRSHARAGARACKVREVAEMKRAVFEELLASVRQATEIARGARTPSRTFEINAVAIKELRSRTKLSQQKFAALLGVELSTFRNWEQGRREPTGPAKALLRAIRNDPEHVIKALSRAA